MPAHDGDEVELKLIAADAGPLERLAAAPRLGPALLGEATTVHEVDRYLDTADGRLARERWACRLRSREGTTIVSLKGPGRVSGAVALHRRREVEGPATEAADPAAWPPSAARDLVRELAGDAPLVERFRLLQERTERPVSLDGRRAGTLSLDRVVVAREDRTQGPIVSAGRIFVVELEVDADAGADPAGMEARAAALADALGSEAGLRPDRLSKLEHALRLIEAATGDPALPDP